MMGLYYFTPRAANRDDVARLGLEYAFEGLPILREVDGSLGPEGRGGTLLFQHALNSLPNRLIWNATRRADLWIAWEQGARPGPHELLRMGMAGVAAVRVRLADGKWWLIPRVLACHERDPQRADSLPRTFTVTSGALGQKLEARYQPLLKEAERFLLAFQEGTANQIPSERLIDFCGRLLGVCYQIGPEETLVLELLTPSLVELLVCEAIDALEWIKADASAELAELVEIADRERWTWAMFQQAEELARQEVPEE